MLTQLFAQLFIDENDNNKPTVTPFTSCINDYKIIILLYNITDTHITITASKLLFFCVLPQALSPETTLKYTTTIMHN